MTPEGLCTKCGTEPCEEHADGHECPVCHRKGCEVIKRMQEAVRSMPQRNRFDIDKRAQVKATRDRYENGELGMSGGELEAAVRDLRALCHAELEAEPVTFHAESVARIAVLAHEARLRVSDFPTLDRFFAAVEAFAQRK